MKKFNQWLQEQQIDENWFMRGIQGAKALLQGQGSQGAKAAMDIYRQNQDANTIQQIAARTKEQDLKQLLDAWVAKYKEKAQQQQQQQPQQQQQQQQQPQQQQPQQQQPQT